VRIIITGTSSGIGHGLAEEFLSRGHQVLGISRRGAGALGAEDGYRHLQLDLTDFDALQRELPGFLIGVEALDLTVLNAGALGRIRWMEEVSVQEMKRVMEINVWANKVLLDLLFAHVPKIKQVVGMSTKASLRSSPGWGPYSVSKAGLNMLMDVYAKEYPGTHFNAFAPGLIESEILHAVWDVEETDKYPAAGRLQEVRGTDEILEPGAAAPHLIQGMERALDHESGSFVDVREI
jgi:NAD(P)-dependent dehydrogenase (short-subunit alcohol dehydrogenase family)